jgi:hypothetical protein
VLKPQDILVTLKFLTPDSAARQTYAALGESLGLSASESHAAVKRAIRSGLLLESVDRLATVQPCSAALAELLCHGLRYFFPPETGSMATGISTAESALPLSLLFSTTDAPPWVWPHRSGNVRGISFEPLYPTAPDAALRDPALGEWLALADALRSARGRVAALARDEVQKRLRDLSYAAAA